MDTNFFTLKIRKDKVIETINVAAGLGIFIAIFSIILFFWLVPKSEFYSTNLIIVLGELLVYLLLSLGVFLKSRISAILLLAIFIFDKISIGIYAIIYNMGIVSPTSNFIVGFFIAFLLLRGVKATFVYHKYMKSKD